jgi:hypothetical protein
MVKRHFLEVTLYIGSEFGWRGLYKAIHATVTPQGHWTTLDFFIFLK